MNNRWDAQWVLKKYDRQWVAMQSSLLNWHSQEPAPNVTSLDEFRQRKQRKGWLQEYTRPMPPEPPRVA